MRRSRHFSFGIDPSYAMPLSRSYRPHDVGLSGERCPTGAPDELVYLNIGVGPCGFVPAPSQLTTGWEYVFRSLEPRPRGTPELLTESALMEDGGSIPRARRIVRYFLNPDGIRRVVGDMDVPSTPSDAAAQAEEVLRLPAFRSINLPKPILQLWAGLSTSSHRILPLSLPSGTRASVMPAQRVSTLRLGLTSLSVLVSVKPVPGEGITIPACRCGCLPRALLCQDSVVWSPGHWLASVWFWLVRIGDCVGVDDDCFVFSDDRWAPHHMTAYEPGRLFDGPVGSTWARMKRLAWGDACLGIAVAIGSTAAAWAAGSHVVFFMGRTGFSLLSVTLCAIAVSWLRYRARDRRRVPEAPQREDREASDG